VAIVFETEIPSAAAVGPTFAYMADMRNIPQWDDTIERVDLDGGPEPPAIGARYAVHVRAGGRRTRIDYETAELDPIGHTRWVGRSDALRSDDTVHVTAGPDGRTVVRYRAELELQGARRFAEPLMGIAFKRASRKAAANLREILADPARIGAPAA
jgi:hypothetical protein